MPRSTVTSKGQITIPKEIRDQMGLKPGDRVDFVSNRKGEISLRIINTDFRSLRGILKSRRAKPLTIEEMDEAIARGACGE
jgi:antitoxin PrlF